MILHFLNARRLRLAVVLWLAGWGALPAAEVTMVPRWQRFERTFRSELTYSNPFAVAFQVEFRSPQGEKQVVPGFWDGGKVWRVRMLPGMAGRWSFRTLCSDSNNPALHGRTGEFLCTAGERGNRFREHGPIRVAHEGTFFEHADRTPLFLATELAWNAVRRDGIKEFDARLRELSRQQVNAIAWTLWPGKDDRGDSAFDLHAPGGLNLEFLQRLDARVDAITSAGLLNVIAPSWEVRQLGEEVSEAQTVVLLRQAMARWQANPALWLVAVESGSTGAKIGRWRRIADAAFTPGVPGPVVFLPGETHWLWEEFRSEKWINALGFKTAHLGNEAATQWFLNGPIAVENQQRPLRPVLDLLPMNETPATAVVGARQLLWWGLLLNPPAGVSGLSQGATNAIGGRIAALRAADFMSAIDFRRLRPAPRLLAKQPGAETPAKFVAVAASENRDLLVAYVPAGPTVQLTSIALPPRHTDSWFNPRSGQRVLAAGVVNADGVTYRTPGDGDWVLLVRAER